MSILKRIAINSFISAGARILGIALALINIGFIARYLNVSGFGDYVFVFAYIYTFSVLADLGLYSIAVRDISRENTDPEKIMSNIFTIRAVSLIFFLGAASLIAVFLPYSTTVKASIAVGAVSYVFLWSSQVLISVFQKHLKMERVAIAELCGRVAQLGAVLLFIWLNKGLVYVVFSVVIGSFVHFVIQFLSAKKYIKVKLSCDFDYWKRILKESLPVAASIVLVYIYFKLDTLILAFYKGSYDVGIYGVGYRVLESLIFFPAMFVGLVMPLLSKFGLGAKEKFANVFKETQDILIVFIVPLVVGIVFLARPIVVLIGGPAYEESAIVLQILSFAIGLIFLGNLFGNAVIALNKQKKAALVYLGGAFFNVILNVIFIPKYSYIGAAGTTVFTEAIVSAFLVLILWNCGYRVPSIKTIIKVVAAAFVMGFFLFASKDLNLFAAVALSALIYFVALYLLKGIPRTDFLQSIK